MLINRMKLNYLKVTTWKLYMIFFFFFFFGLGEAFVDILTL